MLAMVLVARMEVEVEEVLRLVEVEVEVELEEVLVVEAMLLELTDAVDCAAACEMLALHWAVGLERCG